MQGIRDYDWMYASKWHGTAIAPVSGREEIDLTLFLCATKSHGRRTDGDMVR
jgi:hypothetical protein